MTSVAAIPSVERPMGLVAPSAKLKKKDKKSTKELAEQLVRQLLLTK